MGRNFHLYIYFVKSVNNSDFIGFISFSVAGQERQEKWKERCYEEEPLYNMALVSSMSCSLCCRRAEASLLSSSVHSEKTNHLSRRGRPPPPVYILSIKSCS